MSELKHTPGPWRVGEDPRLHEVVSEKGVVCQFYEYGEIKPARKFGNAESNSRLIAAAPDLLEVCQDIVGESALAISYTNYERMIEAIKKATGES